MSLGEWEGIFRVSVCWLGLKDLGMPHLHGEAFQVPAWQVLIERKGVI